MENLKNHLSKVSLALVSVAQLVGTSYCGQKGHRFDSWLGNI